MWRVHYHIFVWNCSLWGLVSMAAVTNATTCLSCPAAIPWDSFVNLQSCHYVIQSYVCFTTCLQEAMDLISLQSLKLASRFWVKWMALLGSRPEDWILLQQNCRPWSVESAPHRFLFSFRYYLDYKHLVQQDAPIIIVTHKSNPLVKWLDLRCVRRQELYYPATTMTYPTYLFLTAILWCIVQQ